MHRLALQRLVWSLTVPATLLATPSVRAADDELPSPRTSAESMPSAWELVVGAWLPRFEGKLTFGSGGTEIEAGDLDLDDLEATPAAELAWRGEWISAAVGGFSFSTSGNTELAPGTVLDGTTISTATAARTTASAWSAGGRVSVALWKPFARQTALWNAPKENVAGVGARGSSIDLAFDATLSVQYLSISQRIEPVGAAIASFDHDVLGLGLGGGLRFRWNPGEVVPPIHEIGISASAAIGPALFGGGTFVELQASLDLELVPGIAARFGYRLLDWTIESGGDRSVAGLQGLFLGGRIRF